MDEILDAIPRSSTSGPPSWYSNASDPMPVIQHKPKPQNVRHLLTVSQIQMRMEAHSLLAACKIKERDSLPWWAFIRYSLMTNEAERLEARASECMAILGRG